MPDNEENLLPDSSRFYNVSLINDDMYTTFKSIYADKIMNLLNYDGSIFGLSSRTFTSSDYECIETDLP